MVKRLVLIDKFYNFTNKTQERELIKKYLKYLHQISRGFPHTKILFKKMRKFDKRIEVEVSGPEEVFLFNLLKKEVGSIMNFEDVGIQDIIKGNLVDVGKVGFGLFVDCAIFNPTTDVLVNLHTLRNQLYRGIEKSLKEIIKIYDFIDHYPVFIKIDSVNEENHQLQGIFAEQTLNFYRKLISENLEAIFLSGETKEQFKKALIKSGHLRDVVSIERYGFLENIIILKEGTNAPGIISDIGKYLKYSKISAIRPERIKTVL
ncbi:MAG: DUF2110 family protein [Candidatus Thorarchaeota archaeon]